MAQNDYRILKEQSDGSFVERQWSAEEGKACSFNVDLDPEMISIKNTYLVSAESISDGGWNLNSGFYEYDHALSDATDGMVARIIPYNGDYQAWKDADILPRHEVTNGNIRLYATNIPATPIRVDIILSEFTTF